MLASACAHGGAPPTTTQHTHTPHPSADLGQEIQANAAWACGLQRLSSKRGSKQARHSCTVSLRGLGGGTPHVGQHGQDSFARAWNGGGGHRRWPCLGIACVRAIVRVCAQTGEWCRVAFAGLQCASGLNSRGARAPAAGTRRACTGTHPGTPRLRCGRVALTVNVKVAAGRGDAHADAVKLLGGNHLAAQPRPA